jgi:GT2 family glycosyltransferase
MSRVTVLFPTLNGAHTLPRMLETLERLEPPTGGWKVVAVDNGSTDDSLEILKRYAVKLPMTVLSEPRRGKNIALNSALALVEGDLVALTDDDIILPLDWLMTIENAAAQNLDYDIFGGAIHPVWEECPPDWLLRCVPKSWLGWTDFPEGPINPHSVFGANMAVRSSVFRAQKFAEGIGPNGSTLYAMGSETEFTMRAERAGHRCWHFRAAPVGHIIRAHQLKREWLQQRAYNLARGDRRKFRIFEPDARLQVFGYPLRYLFGFVRGAGHLAAAACNVARARLLGDFEDRFRADLRLRYYRGDMAERCAQEKARMSYIRRQRRE